MFQAWNCLTFLHWRYAPEIIRPLLPRQLQLDTFDGSAWIGLTPFLLTGLRPPLFPAVPWISQFPEMNVRTYVRGPDGEHGIWFFSLEADRILAVIGARVAYGLPYRWAEMSVAPHSGTIAYTSKRHFGSGRARIVIVHESPIQQANDQEVFLTARFRLYTRLAGRLAFAQVEHRPWPLESARAIELDQNVIENSGLPPAIGTPIVHFSPGVHVRIGRPAFLRAQW
ncbi:MAG: YqjF family protein [Bryobacteraceae bacterium]